jgi:hypothetical protein
MEARSFWDMLYVPKGDAETEWVIRTVKEELLCPNEFASFEEAQEEVSLGSGKTTTGSTFVRHWAIKV